jgi:CDP-diacylglycerol--serine O-phosphatidyltransferase
MSDVWPPRPAPSPPSREPGGLGRRRRRRRARGGRRRGLYLLPSLLTTGNLFSGFYAIVQATRGDPWYAALGIVAAAIFDALDGRIARLTNSTSRFGAEYDSLADVVSFGIAPAMLAFAAGDLQELGRKGWVLSFVFAVCAALRLARFNVHPSRYHNRFEGLPSPAAAGMVASSVWFMGFLRETLVDFRFPPIAAAAGTVAVGLLMVSKIPYRSFKEVDLRQSYGTLVLAVIALALVVFEPSVMLFLLGLAFVASGPVEWLWRRTTGNPLEETAHLPDEGAQKDGAHEHGHA